VAERRREHLVEAEGLLHFADQLLTFGDLHREQLALAVHLGIDYPVAHLPPEHRARLFAGESVPIPLSLLVGRDGRLQGLVAGWSADTRTQIQRLAAGD
jgi:hypothetical protein